MKTDTAGSAASVKHHFSQILMPRCCACDYENTTVLSYTPAGGETKTIELKYPGGYEFGHYSSGPPFSMEFQFQSVFFGILFCFVCKFGAYSLEIHREDLIGDFFIFFKKTLEEGDVFLRWALNMSKMGRIFYPHSFKTTMVFDILGMDYLYFMAWIKG